MNEEYVLFLLDRETYAINIENVENIEKHIDITRVPYAKDYVDGVINLRGNIIPIINLRRRFSLEEKPIDDDTRIIITSKGDNKIGILVDVSSEVLRITDSEKKEVPKMNNGKDISFVQEIVSNEDRLIQIIDLSKVLDI